MCYADSPSSSSSSSDKGAGGGGNAGLRNGHSKVFVEGMDENSNGGDGGAAAAAAARRYLRQRSGGGGSKSEGEPGALSSASSSSTPSSSSSSSSSLSSSFDRDKVSCTELREDDGNDDDDYDDDAITKRSSSITSSSSLSTTTPSRSNKARINDDNNLPQSLPYSSCYHYYYFPFFVLVAVAAKEFSVYFPFVLAPHAAFKTYVHAGYAYDPHHSRFDNTAWTWATDYALAALMVALAVRCLTSTIESYSSSFTIPYSYHNSRIPSPSRTLRIRSALLLVLYAVSTVAGGYAHQMYLNIESMNTWSFRLIWTVCVGSVCAAGGVMGSIGTEVCRLFHANGSRRLMSSGKESGWDANVLLRLPLVPDHFWVFWGLYITAVCVRGDISYQRPACDIFIAGTTQFVPTFYCVSLLLVRRWHHGVGHAEEEKEEYDDTSSSLSSLSSSKQPARYVSRPYRIAYYLGFIDNSVLLPAYPLLVQYSGWSLGTINALLHMWLTLSWSMQAVGLEHLCLAVDRAHRALVAADYAHRANNAATSASASVSATSFAPLSTETTPKEVS